jgi:VIT1/CCC1 family predicted Fe2+/Mn2+ transporter
MIPDDHLSSHTPAAIARRLRVGPAHSYLRDFVYGAIDGSVTTFSVVAAVAGAGLSPAIVIVLGIANLIADGFSMAAGNFLATRTEEERRRRLRRTEESHIDQYPAGEREEVRQILEKKGFSGSDLERAVDVITADRKQWVDTMLREEHGVSLHGGSPWRAAAATFVAFVSVGLLPLGAFVVQAAWPDSVGSPFAWSAALTGLAFFSVGAAKGPFVGQRWDLSGLETLGVGGAAATLSYLLGLCLKGLVGAAL